MACGAGCCEGWMRGFLLTAWQCCFSDALQQACACPQVCLWRLLRLHAEVREDEEWSAPSGKDITDLQSCKFCHKKLHMQSVKLEAPVQPGSIKRGTCGSLHTPASACLAALRNEQACEVVLWLTSIWQLGVKAFACCSAGAASCCRLPCSSRYTRARSRRLTQSHLCCCTDTPAASTLCWARRSQCRPGSASSPCSPS